MPPSRVKGVVIAVPLWDHGVSGGPMSKQPVTYAAAGVDINRQDEALARIKPLVKATKTPGVRSDIGLFGGLFAASVPGAQAHPGGLHGRRRHQDEGGAPGGPVGHRRRRSGEPLHQRHPRPGRPAPLLPGLHRRPAPGARGHRADRQGHGRRLQGRGLRPHRRRAGRDAGRLRRGRGGCGGHPSSAWWTKADLLPRLDAMAAGRRADRPAQLRPAHQRLLPGPEGLLRGGRS